MQRLLLVIGVFFISVLAFPSCQKSSADNTKTVNVSGLLSITGNWSTLGIDSKAALQFAADDINTYLKSKGAAFRMSVSFYDTKLDPDSARLAFVNAVSNGTHFIIGPQSSAELAAIAPLANAGQVIVVSQGSTAGSLAIANDPVFRFCPPDKAEGAAIANTIYKAGIQGLVTLARNDAGNLGLQSATGASFIAKGGTINALGAYSSSLTDFTSAVASLKSAVSQFVSAYGSAHTAVYLASFDEGATLLAQAASDSELSNVKWYGGDGMALSIVLPANATASDFAIKTGFFTPSFGLPASLQSTWQPVADRIKASTGIAPDAFALAAYDAMWVIAHTLEVTKGVTTDFSQLETLFPQQSNIYSGLTGSTALDSLGDRATGSFDYWGITKNGNNYQWTLAGQSD